MISVLCLPWGMDQQRKRRVRVPHLNAERVSVIFKSQPESHQQKAYRCENTREPRNSDAPPLSLHLWKRGILEPHLKRSKGPSLLIGISESLDLTCGPERLAWHNSSIQLAKCGPNSEVYFVVRSLRRCNFERVRRESRIRRYRAGSEVPS